MSVDSQFSHLAWVQTDRKSGGLGDLAYRLVADLKKEISSSFDVLTEEGVALRGLFIIDKEGVIQHSTINNLAFGRNVDEALRVLQVRKNYPSNVGTTTLHWYSLGRECEGPRVVPKPLRLLKNRVFSSLCTEAYIVFFCRLCSTCRRTPMRSAPLAGPPVTRP